jgi:hypothetical protein
LVTKTIDFSLNEQQIKNVFNFENDIHKDGIVFLLDKNNVYWMLINLKFKRKFNSEN